MAEVWNNLREYSQESKLKLTFFLILWIWIRKRYNNRIKKENWIAFRKNTSKILSGKEKD